MEETTDHHLLIYRHLGKMAGIHAKFENALRSELLILASSLTPPDLQSGPTGFTFHRISSEFIN